MKLKVGLFGINGHQLHRQPLPNQIDIVAFAGFDNANKEQLLRQFPSARDNQSLDQLLQNPDVDLISLCSPRRDEQAEHTLRAMRSGKHVLAEKPCALKESDLDSILQTSIETGRIFHEMAGTAFEQPYWAMRNQIKAGKIGEVVQIYVQKSYPMFDDRPRDEGIDGGLLCQVGIHAIRYIEQIGGLNVCGGDCIETQLGIANPLELRSAANISLVLENGALAVGAINYCNPRGFPSWGNETLRIWGPKGMIEAIDGGKSTRLVIGTQDLGHVPGVDEKAPDFLQSIVDQILTGKAPLLTPGEEIHPTRIVLRCKQKAKLATPVVRPT
jgi:predicted dehydrogenase